MTFNFWRNWSGLLTRLRTIFLTWYLNNTLDLYQKAQETVHTRLPTAKSVVASPLEFVRNLLAGHSLRAQGPPVEAEELEKLRGQIEELQMRLRRREKGARTGTKRKRRKRRER